MSEDEEKEIELIFAEKMLLRYTIWKYWEILSQKILHWYNDIVQNFMRHFPSKYILENI